MIGQEGRTKQLQMTYDNGMQITLAYTSLDLTSEQTFKSAVIPRIPLVRGSVQKPGN